MKRLLLSMASLATLAACTVGPDYAPPATAPAAAAPFIGTAGPQVSADPAAERWWQLYDDPVLDSLVGDALAANTDIWAAVARLDQVRARLREARGDRLPQTSVDASAAYGRSPATAGDGNRERWSVDVGLGVAYELDLFGRVSRNIEAARSDTAAAAADADAVRVLIAAETTRAYADAAAAAERIAVAERVIALLDSSVRLTEKRFEAGRAARLDVARISALRDQRRALLPPLIADRDAALFRLATLTGRPPRELPPIAGQRVTILDLGRPIPVGDGAALLARRPDVRAAERRLGAATARIGVATADLYPRISLGGSLGSSGSGFGNLFGGGPLTWLLGPLVSWSFPNQEAVRARIEGSEAGSREALAEFDGAVLTALRETETALSVYANAIREEEALRSALAQAEKAVTITRARQREGVIDFLEVLDAERTFADANAELVAARSRTVAAQIDLFRALGGGWQAPDMALASR
jgi:NodT family efflux transporter outer membrane factor (OMF) lipoprotein